MVLGREISVYPHTKFTALIRQIPVMAINRKLIVGFAFVNHIWQCLALHQFGD